MNVMKRFLLGSGNANSSNQSQQPTNSSSSNPNPANDIPIGIKPSPSQHAALSLTHLRKLFTDFSNPITSQHLTDAERESRIYCMLPLFCRVFSHCPANEMVEKFPEVASFCQHVSRLAVSEIRKRASNQSTVAASSAIAKFLEMDSVEEASNGWMLLSSLNLLSLGGPALIEVMTVASIPSTLVKCLYLFFDLPDLENADILISGCEFTHRERRLLLQKLFGQMLVRLCSIPAATEELVRKDDLTLVFSALSSVCPPHNLLWRKNANEVLVALTRHGLTPNVLGYIHNKGCISLCIDNMKKASQDLSPLELVEMFVTVFCLLKDSSEITQSLLDDFRSCQGYYFLTDFLLRVEHDGNTESQEALRNLVFLVSSLTTCGFHELRPMALSTGSPFQLPGFSVPHPAGKGSSVRNIPSFQVLHNVFIKSTTTLLCSTILDAISTIFHSDPANYFILESQNTLNQFAEKIHLKSAEVQEKFFRLVEFVIFQLNYVPCKELISLSLILKKHPSVQCSINCMMLLLTVLRHHTIFKDVFREVGLLEVLVTCLHRFANLLKEKTQAERSNIEYAICEEETKLGYLVMESLSILLVGNANNAAIFRESGGARCAHNLIPYPDCRREALGIVQQLVLSTGGDDDMGTVLGLLQSASATNLTLKMDILKSLLSCLRESHRTRTMFRKVGGFVYVMSTLVSMETSLGLDTSTSQWHDFSDTEILRMLHLVFNTVCVAMRYEPANAKFFQQEICGTSLCDTLRLLGCYSQEKIIEQPCAHLDILAIDKYYDTFYQIFNGGVQEYNECEEKEMKIPKNASLIFRLLYDLAIDSYDKAQAIPININKSLILPSKPVEGKVAGSKRPNVTSLNLNPSQPEPFLVHPGVVIAMFHLIPSIFYAEDQQAEVALKLFVTDIVQSLLRSERNVQSLCDTGFPSEILQCAKNVLRDESHYLHTPLLTIFERLSCHALEPKDLREFLRMGDPLNCVLPEMMPEAVGGLVPLTRVKTLVSMATPRDIGQHGKGTPSLPPFVEFDMQPEGFGCLFLPSVAPQCHTSGMANIGGGAGIVVMGGVGGGGDRVFPAQTGMSFSTWICVDKFSDPRLDPHGVRLLTLVRNIMDREENLICLSVMLSPRDKALLVSTQETPLPKGTSDWEPEVTGDFGVRIWTPDLIHEGQWHHLALVWNRAVLKNSQFSLYVDGQHIHSCKMHYISQNPGGAAANLTVASSVFGYIGTAPSWRRQSRLVWRQGPCHLVEDALHSQAIQWIYKIGPHYVGSLQAPELPGSSEPLCSLVAEDRIMFGLNAVAMSPLTLAKIRKVYRKTDSKAIAKQLGMSSHENATPIRLLHNSGGHLSGPARTLGGVVIGYLGVRVFCPRPVCTTIQAVGGCSTLLGLVGMATDVESLYAAVKTLVCIIKCNTNLHHEMERCHGYQTLAYLLKRHKHLVNNHILHLILTLVGTSDSSRDLPISVANSLAFRDIIVDLDVWSETPDDLLKHLFELLYQMAIESSDSKATLRCMRELNLVSRLLYTLQEIALSPGARHALWNLLAVLLANPRAVDLLLFGQYLATTIPTCMGTDEKSVSTLSEETKPDGCSTSAIATRNEGLTLVSKLLIQGKTANLSFIEELVRVLGFDWFVLFMQPHIHSSSVILSLNCLTITLALPQYLIKFREGSCSGIWMRSTEFAVQSKMGSVLGPLRLVGRSFSGTEESQSSQQTAQSPGFQLLNWLLAYHIKVSEVYYLLIGLMIGQLQPRLSNQLELDNIWSCMFGISRGTGMPIASLGGRGLPVHCPEAISVLFAMIRAIMNPDSTNNSSLSEEIADYPNTVVQFLFYMYHNAPDYMAVFMTSDVLSSVVSSLFPSPSASDFSSECNTPVDECKYVLEAPLSKEPTLTSHPSKKSIMDFLRTIIVDSLSLPSTNKSLPVIDVVLDACPESSNHQQQCQFQTELLSTVMDYLGSADVILGDQSVLPIVAGGSSQNIAPNVMYIAGRLVDKLWQGTLQKNPHEVFDFVIQLITQSKKRSVSLGTVTLDNVYRCMNRCILFLLSRPTDSVSQQMSVLEMLHKLTSHRSLVFGSGNHDLEFIGCLTYCLLQLTSDMKIVTEPQNKTTWHVNPQQQSNADDVPTGLQQAQNLTSIAARRVWEELYISKKPAIEESFKVSLGTTNKAPSLDLVRDQIREPSQKLWLAYIEAERRSVYRTIIEVPNQIQSKIQKVTGGLTRLASRTKTKREEPVIKTRCLSLSWDDVFLSTQSQLIALKDQVDAQWKIYQQAQQHTDKYMYQNWKRMEAELTRERGVWGPTTTSRILKWMLDMTEGPCRMRKKLTHNPFFYIHYPYRPELECGENKSLKYKVATSLDSKDYHKYYANWKPSLLNEKEPDGAPKPNEPTVKESKSLGTVPLLQPCQEVSEVEDQFEELTQLKDLPKILSRSNRDRIVSEVDEEPDPLTSLEAIGQASVSDESHVDQDQPQDSHNLLRLLEDNEKISHLFRCARVEGLDTIDGLLLFGKEHLYVVDGFTQTQSREIRDVSNFPPGTFEPIVPPYKTPGYGSGSPTRASLSGKSVHQCSTIGYEDIREVHKRRYLLQPIALEVFSNDGRNYLLAFPPNVRNKVYQRLLATATGLSDSASQSVAGQKRTANVEQGAGLLSSLMGETSVTQRWVRGEISNFQYLMHLNTLAGRSYNDLMQYPVFPWVLADYDSSELDLTNPSTFRDFSKPMGAQTPERLAQFRKRYKEWDDPHNETGPYHYGTHYSSAMIVCSYLVRLEPFTQHFLHLQGGHFDLADRMFHSIKEGWTSAAKHNMADVKELIPEFFYLPDMLTNHNKFDLGMKQSGVALNDVLLPPWAKDDAREFIRVHRAALECDYVSQHLHEWIDLIFGYKQQGPPAVEAVNVFHPLFYEGNVDIYSIEDPLKKNAVIGFINNFGQIPKQLFKKPHPCKKVAKYGGIDIPLPLGQGVIPLPTPSALTPSSPDSRDRLFFHHIDHLSPSLQSVKELKRPVGQIICTDRSIVAVEENKCLLPPNYTRCIAWGYADHSLRLIPQDSERALMVCETPFHGEILTSVCPTGKTIITGGTNTVVTVWELGKKQFTIRQHLYGHTDAVTCMAASAGYQILVSGSRDRTAIVWDLSRLSFIRQLVGHNAPLAAVAVNELTGDLATCAGTWLHLWSINGEPLATVNTLIGQMGRSQHILCVCFSQCNEWDPLNVILTGSTDGVVRMWSLDYVQVPKEESSSDIADVSTVSNPSTKLETSQVIKSPDTTNDAAETVETESESSDETEFEDEEDQDLPDDEGDLDDEDNCTLSQQMSREEADNAKTTTKLQRQLPLDAGTSVDENLMENSVEVTKGHAELTASGSSASKVKLRKRKDSSNPQKRTAASKSEGLVLSASLDKSINETEILNEERTHLGAARPQQLRSSRSDGSINDSFEVITESEVQATIQQPAGPSSPRPLGMSKKSRHVLKEGFKWQRQLIFRSKLTMHTAYDRPDNTDPASITAIAISKDHRTVLVGDARGRVHSWGISDLSGRSIADHWLKDETVECCNQCRVKFSLTERRHHCRNCGHVFCSRCSRFESEILQLRIRRPVRVCQSCFSALRGGAEAS